MSHIFSHFHRLLVSFLRPACRRATVYLTSPTPKPKPQTSSLGQPHTLLLLLDPLVDGRATAPQERAQRACCAGVRVQGLGFGVWGASASSAECKKAVARKSRGGTLGGSLLETPAKPIMTRMWKWEGSCTAAVTPYAMSVATLVNEVSVLLTTPRTLPSTSCMPCAPNAREHSAQGCGYRTFHECK